MKGRSTGSIKKRLVDSTDPIIIKLSVPNDILDNVKECLRTHLWIESQDILPTQSDQQETEIKYTLFSEYRNDDVNEFIANIVCYKSLTVETLEFLSKYSFNQEALKSYLKITEDASLFDRILNHIDESADLSEFNELSVEEILPSSVKMLLNRKFKGDVLFKLLLTDELNTNQGNQIDSIKALISNEAHNFNWGSLTFYAIEYRHLLLLIEQCAMPLDEALKIFNHCVVDGNSIKQKKYAEEYQKLIHTLFVRAKESGDITAVKKIYELSREDPLFQFLKLSGQEDIVESFQNDNKAHMAIAYPKGLSSLADYLNFARLIVKGNKDIDLHLVSLELLEKQKNELMKLFDGVILPSSYIEGFYESSFTKNDVNETDAPKISELYFKLIDAANEFNIPLLASGIGAHHIILEAGGALSPKECDKLDLNITFKAGTFSYFMLQNKVQQDKIITQKYSPECLEPISFTTDITNNHVADSSRLGKDMILAAETADNNPIVFRSKLKFGVQYDIAGEDRLGTNYQKNFINSFLQLVRMHNKHKINPDGVISPESYIDQALLQMKKIAAHPGLDEQEESAIAGNVDDNFDKLT